MPEYKFIIGIICLLLIGIPNTSAVYIKKPTYLSNIQNEYSYQTQDEPPTWALGNFTGYWGLNIVGQPGIPLGLVFGYYGAFRFVAVFTNTTAPNGYLVGIRFSYFMFGIIANITGVQKTLFVGLGGSNETETDFYYRIMGILGPTFYIAGTYNKFT